MPREPKASRTLLLRESALRAMVRILLESRALKGDAAGYAARDGDGRHEEWSNAAEALDGIPAAKQMLAWLSNARNVKLDDRLEPFVGQLLDWARHKEAGHLDPKAPSESDIGRMSPEDLRNTLDRMRRRASIGRSMDVRMPREGHLFEVTGDPAPDGGRTTWVVYFPETPGESCAIAELVSPGNEGYRIDWCTARRKNNQFYGYAASGTLLYYAVNRRKPEEKYSIGMVRGPGGGFRIVEPKDNGITVSWQNLAFDPADAFGSAWDGILRGIRDHARKLEGTGHPIAQEVLAAAQDERAWKVLKDKTSDDPVHLWQLFSVLVDPSEADAEAWGERGGMIAMKPTIAMDLPLAVVRALASAENQWMAPEALVAAEAVIQEYAGEVPSSRVDAIVKAIEEHERRNPSGDGRYTAGERVISMLVADRRAREDVPAATAALPAGTDGMREWFAQNAKLLPTRSTLVGQQGSLGRAAATIASRMSDEQLLAMVNPFSAFPGLRDEVPPNVRRYEPTPEIWLRELFLRMARSGHPRAWSGTPDAKAARIAQLERSLFGGRRDGAIGRVMVGLQEAGAGRAGWMGGGLDREGEDVLYDVRMALEDRGWAGA